MTRHRRRARGALALPLLTAVVLAGCGTSGLSADEWTWCSNVDHMAREVAGEARSMNLIPPANADNLTDYALYWATYYYRTGKVKDLRSQPDFIKACAAAYNSNPH